MNEEFPLPVKLRMGLQRDAAIGAGRRHRKRNRHRPAVQTLRTGLVIVRPIYPRLPRTIS